MAETVHLFLKVGGADIQGTSLGRENSIECPYFEHEITTPRDAASGAATGRRQYAPILIRKRIDKASPLLIKALTDNQRVDGTFRLYRPNLTGDGTTEQFYTIEFSKGRIASLKQDVPDVLTPETASLPPLEEVAITFQTISWTYTNGGVTHEDSWRAR